MGLRDLLGRRSAAGDPGLMGTAVVIESRPVANTETAEVRANEEVANNELWALNLGKRPHDLTLEVRMPGAAAYETEVRESVPARFCHGASLALPEGLELPVRRAGSRRDGIAVDWKAYAAKAGVRAEVRRQGARAHNDAVREGLERTQPEVQARARADNAEVIVVWTAQVQAGALKRKHFDQSCRTLITLGQLDPELYDAAVRELDGG
ncbi:hypothetical protein HJD18_05005 [Thermoleophilia bacterium SCSIO 60948]|nr:hypothetical protein HJD18_05005 [Thermoleophilia bacterium SCSIO 60948]